MTEMLDQLEYVRRVRLSPGDTLVVKSSRRITRDQADQIIAQFKEKFPGHEVAVLAPEWDLVVVGPDEEEQE